MVGIDPILGLDENYKLSKEIRSYLKENDMNTLDRIKNKNCNYKVSFWLKAKDFGFTEPFAWEWDRYIFLLDSAGCRLSPERDSLIWTRNLVTCEITAKYAYDALIKDKCYLPQQWWDKRILTWKILLTLKCFFWFALLGRLKTWDNLLRMGWNGPNLCFLCKKDVETSHHLLVLCDFTKKLWTSVCSMLIIEQAWGQESFDICTLDWSRKCRDHYMLPVIISWYIWYSRNKVIFDKHKLSLQNLSFQVLNVYQSLSSDRIATNIQKINIFYPKFIFPFIFFDGAARDGLCAAGGAIFLNQFHYVSLRLNCG